MEEMKDEHEVKIEACGGYRRGLNYIDDIVILISKTNDEQVLGLIETLVRHL
jgi:DNA polymerase/3'-5' exonuclease PolX